MHWLAVAIGGSLAGCVINGVKPAGGSGAGIARDRSLVVVGITVAGAWPAPRFGVTLDRYDITKQAITGDCLFYDRIEADVPAARAPTRYLAFDVPAGAYVYSAFNAARFDEPDSAFRALPGRAVYVGDFVLGDGGVVTLRRDLAASRAAIAQALPTLPADLASATGTVVAPPRAFLCTP